MLLQTHPISSSPGRHDNRVCKLRVKMQNIPMRPLRGTVRGRCGAEGEIYWGEGGEEEGNEGVRETMCRGDEKEDVSVGWCVY